MPDALLKRLPHEGEARMSPDALIARIAAAQHGVFTKTQALEAGVSDKGIRHRVALGRWRQLHPGVYALAGVPPTWEQSVIAATLSLGGVASGPTAGRLLGLVEKGFDRPVHVTLGFGQSRRARRYITLHSAVLHTNDVRTVKDIPTTAPNRTIVDIAATTPPRVLEAALDNAIQLGLTTIPSLLTYISDRGLWHNRGVGRLKKLMQDRAEGAVHKELEKLFRRKLKASGLPAPVRQYPLGRYSIDCVYPQQRIAIELDGLGGHFSAEAARRDKRKGNAIVLAGFDLLRFSWEDVNDLWPQVEETLRAALSRAG